MLGCNYATWKSLRRFASGGGGLERGMGSKTRELLSSSGKRHRVKLWEAEEDEKEFEKVRKRRRRIGKGD
ncbi:hypothetical protein LINPERHAP2_LOCUS16780, partial [Linum perenne]